MMARIHLSKSFTLMEEGEQVLRIYGVEYKETFGVLTVYLVNAKGQTMRETFKFLNVDGSANEGALSAFSYFARVAMDDPNMDDLDDHEDLVNHYIRVEVVHNKGANGTSTYANLGRDKAVAYKFDTPATKEALTMTLGDKPVSKNTPKPQPEESKSSSLDDLF